VSTNIIFGKAFPLCTQRKVPDMVKLGYSGSKLELTELNWNTGGARKVGILRRKSGDKVYESPRIVLDRRYEKFTGKRYKAYKGRAIVEHEGYQTVKPWNQEGDCIVLFFPDQWNKPEPENPD